MNAAMTVDVNTIPSAAIARVEVISGGAAATYGPDAMAGVRLCEDLLKKK